MIGFQLSSVLSCFFGSTPPLDEQKHFSQSARLLPRRAKLSGRLCLRKKKVVRVF